MVGMLVITYAGSLANGAIGEGGPPSPTFAVLSMEPVAMVVLWGLKERHTISDSWPARNRQAHTESDNHIGILLFYY